MQIHRGPEGHGSRYKGQIVPGEKGRANRHNYHRLQEKDQKRKKGGQGVKV